MKYISVAAVTALAVASAPNTWAQEVAGQEVLRVIPTNHCFWSKYEAPQPSKDLALPALVAALAPGLIDAGIGWIANVLKKAGERKTTSRIGAVAVTLGPDHPLPSCLQIMYGKFAFEDGQPDLAGIAPAVNDALLERLRRSGMIATSDGGLPDMWLEVEIHYSPEVPISKSDGPSAYALVPTQLSWNRSIQNGKPQGKRDLLVFVNFTAAASAAEESTIGINAQSTAVSRLTWYKLSAGKPAINTTLAGRFWGAPADVPEAAQGTQLLINALPVTASSWAPFPDIKKNTPINIWVNVTEAKDGIRILGTLGEVLDKQKTAVSTIVQNQVLPANRQTVRNDKETAEIDAQLAYGKSVAKAEASERKYTFACKMLGDHVAAHGVSDSTVERAALVTAASDAFSVHFQDMADSQKSAIANDQKDPRYSKQDSEKLQDDNTLGKVCGTQF